MDKQEIRALITRAQTQDEDALSKLVDNHLDLVWSVVHKFSMMDVERDDLFQIGCIGLLKAIKQFDPTFETTLSTYAIPLIIGEIKAFIRSQSPVKISRQVKMNAYKISMVKETLAKKLERDPTITEIAVGSELSEEQVILALNAPINVASLDNYEKEESPLIERIVDNNEKIFDERIHIKEIVNQLDKTEQTLLYLRFDLGLTQSEAAKRLNINQVAVSRLEKRVLAILKEKMS